MTKENNKIKLKTLKDKFSVKKKNKGSFQDTEEKAIIVDTELEDEDEEPVKHDEGLDPEVLEALNVKKKPKIKLNKEIDYIPELERWEDDSSDTGDDY